MYNVKKIYVLHEYGANNHFFALKYLANQKSIRLYHRELNLYKQLGSAIKHKDFSKLFKFIVNIGFLLSLLFTRNRTIVLGLAPYNFYLLFLRVFLRKHRVFYFTSYTCWDQSRMAHARFYSPKLLSIWKNFINREVKHIFAVSQRTCDEMVANKFSTYDRITVVNHSYKEKIIALNNASKENNFITVGTLSQHKGIEELLDLFKKLPNCFLTIVGKGPLEDLVLEACRQYKNIQYRGYVKGLKNLIPIYQENTFLLLNSQRNDSWEELFGIVLIEGMACGLVPITTDHPGPQEVINCSINGVICEEGKIENGINWALNLDQEQFTIIKQSAINKAQEYQSAIISKRWAEIFN